MNLIDENNEQLTNISKSESKLFWIYNLEERDFFLKQAHSWTLITHPCYVLRIGRREIRIPENYFILIGDSDMGFDTIKPSEILNREFSAFTFSIDMEADSWYFSDIKIVGYDPNSRIVLPRVKHPFPIALDDSTAILISKSEIYNKVKDLSFADIV